MNRLFSYTLRFDDGAAPNPHNRLCTLAICKPRVRSAANVGDWIAGVGSRKATSGNLGSNLVYAMKVEEKLTFEQYDARCRAEWPERIPDVKSTNMQDRLGDCIYDYGSGQPKQRPGVHGLHEMEKDLGGKFVLVAEEFYYFGSDAIPIPRHLLGIRHPYQGHKSNANNALVKPFVQWLRGLGYRSGVMHGRPDVVVNWDDSACNKGCIKPAPVVCGSC